jgi:hypothetical protein
VLGCTSFVAFSLAIDAFLGNGGGMEPPPKPVPADGAKPLIVGATLKA